VKAGILHVQPPAEVLEQMISVRIHLDDCPEENGALRVIAGSHRQGKLPASLPAGYIESRPSVVCRVKSGGVLLMRPLLLHASSASTAPTQRRVIHFDYAAAELPVGMVWAVLQA
jgi:ectoine hydroxylase-related dioxygenase (phytanoyl-CoA dioxygenase family)